MLTSGIHQHAEPRKIPKRSTDNTAAAASVPYIVTLGGGRAKDGGAILLRFKLSDGREIVGALKVGSVGLLVDRIGEYLAQAVERSKPENLAASDWQRQRYEIRSRSGVSPLRLG
jgi:hypothetical protein